MAFINYFNMLLFAMNTLSFLFTLWSKTIVSYRRVKEVLIEENFESCSEKENIDEYEKNNSLRERNDWEDEKENKIENKNVEIEFKNLNFAYEGSHELALENISFQINRGEKVGIIGGIGSGKTTLINLIPKFYNATSGEIKVQNRKLEDWNLNELREKIGIVLQKSFLFSETINDNIKWGNLDATDVEIRESLEISQMNSYVESLPEKGSTLVTKGGLNFSGGQKQRLSIARTIIKNSDILIFDDSFSALDFITESELKKALEERKKEVTTIIISQRVSSVLNLGKIIVLDRGKIVGIGSHKELIKKCEVYREICESQLIPVGDENVR